MRTEGRLPKQRVPTPLSPGWGEAGAWVSSAEERGCSDGAQGRGTLAALSAQGKSSPNTQDAPRPEEQMGPSVSWQGRRGCWQGSPEGVQSCSSPQWPRARRPGFPPSRGESGACGGLGGAERERRGPEELGLLKALGEGVKEGIQIQEQEGQGRRVEEAKVVLWIELRAQAADLPCVQPPTPTAFAPSSAWPTHPANPPRQAARGRRGRPRGACGRPVPAMPSKGSPVRARRAICSLRRGGTRGHEEEAEEGN